MLERTKNCLYCSDIISIKYESIKEIDIKKNFQEIIKKYEGDLLFL